MMLASLLLAVQASTIDTVEMLAMRPVETRLKTSVRESPDAARAAVPRLLARVTNADPDTAAAALAAAHRLANTMAVELRDSFPLSQVAQFEAWTPPERLHKLRVDSLRRAGNFAMGHSGFPAAANEWRHSLEEARRLGDTAGVAAALGNLGAGFYSVGELDSAAVYFTRAETLARQVGDGRTALNALGGLANVRRDRGDLRGAQQLYSRTLAMRERIGDVRGIVADRNNLGILAQNLGDLAGAQEAFKEALALSARHAFSDAAATNLVNLARLSTLRADYGEALAQYGRALTTYRSLGDRQGESLVQRGLGLLEVRRGDYRAARVHLTDALALYREVGPPASVVAVYADLAAASSAAGDLEAADEQLRRAAAWARRTRAEPSTAAALSLARGNLAVDLNSFAEAERWFRRAEELYGQAGDAAGQLEAQQGRGYLLMMDGQHARAATVLGPVVRDLQASGDRRGAALTRLDLAAAQAGAGHEAEARAILHEVRDTLRLLGDPVAEAAALDALADFDLSAGKPAAAESLYREALSGVESHPAPGVTWRLHYGLGKALAAQQAMTPAAAELRAAVQEVEARAAALPADLRRPSYLADKWAAYARLAEVERSRGHDTTSFEVSEWLRAREMLDALARGRIEWRAGADSALIRREQDLRLAITELAGHLEPTDAAPLDLRGPDPELPASAASREALAHVEAAYGELLVVLRERAPGYASMVAGHTATWREVAGGLPPDAALLEYLVADSAATLFVVAAGTVRAIDLHTDRRSLAALVNFTRGTLARPELSAAAARTPLQRLHRLLVEPAEALGLLAHVRQLVIVPHAELHYLPFAALLGGEPQARYLVERYDVTYAPSASVWLQLGRRSARPPAGRILALAPVTTDLPGSRDEVNAIQRLFGARAAVLTGAEANKKALTRALSSYDVLHFATYGVLNRRNPLFSYVQLAADSSEDGRLQVHDIYGLPIDARLVVLSACQTGVGSGELADVPPGDDWVSLVRAFLAAGAERVVGTLWPVEDRSTAELIGWFYGGLATGQGEVEALAGAQRRAIATRSLAGPYYWAGFEIVGRR
jgi:CHAT domain-containing protein